MSMFTYSLLAATLCASTAAAAMQTSGTLLPPAAGDLTPTTLVTPKRAPQAPVEAAPVDFAWAIPSDSTLAAAAPFVAESREFWSLLSAEQLARGYRFDVASPGALIRISPAEGVRSKRVDLGDVVLDFDGRRLAPGAGILRSAQDEQLKALGADFGDGSRVLQLDPALGSGRLELKMPKAGGRHLVHVLEPASDQVLTLSTDRDLAVVGGRLGVFVDWRDGGRSHLPDRIAGLATAPDGRSLDLQFERDASGRYYAAIDVPAASHGTDGLWEVHAFAAARVDGAQLLRDARTSFAVAEPAARLGDRFDARLDAQALTLALDVQAAGSGRYELRGTLYGSAADGGLVPFAVAHAARVLEAGRGSIALRVPAELIRDAGVQAPFELRDVSLNDQGRFARMESRARAVRVDAVPTGMPGADATLQ